ncbi:hypothetical protein GN958_ATG06798, partial [Phytophthora infestans]
IFEGYGEARECGVDCKAVSLWAQRRLPRRKARERDKLFQGKLQIKADRVDELDAGYACSNVTALRFPKTMGKLVGAASTARQSGCGRSVGCQGGKRVSATAVVASTISYGYGQALERGVDCKADSSWARRRLPRRKARERDKLCQGKFQIKADRVDELDAGYACSDVTALRFPTAMEKLVSAASTARRTARGRSVGCQGGKRVSATSVVAGTISEGYGGARECGVDCKAVRLWAQRRLPRRKARERDVSCRWYDFRRLGGSSWLRRRLQGSQVVGAASAAKAEKRVSATSVVAGTISYGYGEARERGVDCKAVRLWAQRRLPRRKAPISEGYGEAPISEGYGEARECGVDCKAGRLSAQRRLPRRKARERDKLFQGKFQIKADRVEDLDAGYSCSDVTALRFPKAMGKLVSAASTQGSQVVGAASAAKAESA